MLRRLFRSRFFSKLFYELLPAAIVSVLGTFLINKTHDPPIRRSRRLPHPPTRNWCNCCASSRHSSPTI
jgi:hypothetical protein